MFDEFLLSSICIITMPDNEIQTGAAGTNLAISKSVTSCMPFWRKPHCDRVSCFMGFADQQMTYLHIAAIIIAPWTLVAVVAIASSTFHSTTARDSSGDIA